MKLFRSRAIFSKLKRLCERFFLVTVLAMSYFRSGASQLHQDEAVAFKEILQTLGKTDSNVNADPCVSHSAWGAPIYNINSIDCSCSIGNDNSCHIVNITLKRHSLPGVLPRELVKLRYLQNIDLAYNYLSGTIPREWGSMKLELISLVGNRLFGPIPKELGNITTLKHLVLEENQLSGELPLELGNLTSLERLQLSSNNFTGTVPEVLAKLANLTDFRISDNRFTGKIPDFIQSWTQLKKLVMQASGLEGPIPPGIYSLANLSDLRISDITGTESALPTSTNKTSMKVLILRNCNLSGQIPEYMWNFKGLYILDLSFNKFSGRIAGDLDSSVRPNFMYLTHNLLTGPIPESFLQNAAILDLSYNNFAFESSRPIVCQQREINLFQSTSTGNNLSGVFPCLQKLPPCEKTNYYLRINCGGEEVTINRTTYEKDQESSGASTFFSRGENWAFSSTGKFLDNNLTNDNYVIQANKSKFSNLVSELYSTARVSPLALTYYGFCLGNGNYTVKLHFLEIIITDDKAYTSLGRRIFDVYIQGIKVLKDFNIKDEAGSHKEVVKEFTANVSNNTLEIHFYWGGKGTKYIPTIGTYGPLISAITVDPEFPVPSAKKIPIAVIVIVTSVVCLVLLVLGILWRKGFLGKKTTRDEDLQGLDLRTGSFTLKQIKAATNNFDISNKIGEGGFGSVYKGQLLDGTTIAVKQLSSKSKQGNREFVNEIGMITALQHPNLVKLYGCCIEGNQLLLVYEYMENNSLARALFGLEDCQLQLDWTMRHKICGGIARGLAYLHEESMLKIVHRDIKASNVLLDKDLNPKISDFGLAKLDESEDTHISTRIAGTIGYMAPEYAMHGYLTDKADVYSFGVVALEIVSGKSITKYRPKGDHIHLIDWAYFVQERGNLVELVDPRLGSEFKKEEAILMINVALLCTSASPSLRPTMSTVVSILEGHAQLPISDPSFPTDGLKYKYTINCVRENESMSQSLLSTTNEQLTSSSTSALDLYPINQNSEYWSNRE